MINEQIINFMRSFEKDHADFDLTVTFEHVLVYEKDLSAVQYSEEQGIKSLLEYLVRSGWEVVEEDGLLVGCKNGKETISLGVGGQVQWSFGPFIDMIDIDQAYLGFIQLLFEELKRRGQILLATGHQPVSLAKDIETVGTKENKALMQYAENKDDYIDFLKCSATMRVSMQYAHIDNFEKRYQAATIIQPALAALLDNAAWVGGKENKDVLVNMNHVRQADETLYHVEAALEESFKYNEFADFLTEAPAIAQMKDGELVYVGAEKVEDVFDTMTKEDIERVLRFVQPRVNMSEYGLTLSLVDSVPYPLNMAYVTMVKTLLYNPDHITALQKMIEEMKEENIVTAHHEMLQKGLKAPMGNGTAFDLVKDLFFMLPLTLSPSEEHYIQSFNSLLFKDITTKEVTAHQFANIVSNA